MNKASKYKLEQKYNLGFACACIHNLKIICNGHTDVFFLQEENNPKSNGSKEVHKPPPEGVYSRNQEREECENWKDSIAEGLWNKYVDFLKQRQQAQLFLSTPFVSQ